MDISAKRLYTSTCVECGNTFERPSGRHIKRCYPCRRQRLERNMDQSRLKTGDLYEAQVRSQLRYWRAEAKRLGIR